MKRILSFALAMILALTLAACGGQFTAASMRLRRTEGTVSVSDGSGKNVPALDNLGLYSGYGVGTRSASYAWIDLDDVKLTKLDQNSEIAIQKEGKALDIELKSGSLFFNVTEPLADDETMNISTSTMLVGIRGTCGWVSCRSGLSQVYILEGKVDCSAGGQTVRVNAGEMGVLTEDGELTVREFFKQDIPAFIQDEVDTGLSGGIGEAPGPDSSEPPEISDTPETPAVSENPAVSEPSEPSGEGETTYFESDNADGLLDILSGAQGGEIIKLTGDIETELTADVRISGASKDNPVVLDLNGHSLTMTGAYSTVYGALTIRDSSGTDSGVLHLDRPVLVQYSASLLVESGGITNDKFDITVSAIGGGVVRVSANSSVTVTGGTINGDINVTSSSLTMNGGTVNGQISVSSGTFTMNDGEVNLSSSSDSGYTVHCGADGLLELNGGSITNSGEGFAVHATAEVTTVGDTVIRAKRSDLCRSGTVSSGFQTWWPEGYTSTEAPDADGYYYLIRQ